MCIRDSVFRDLRNAKIRLQARCLAVSSRCLQWAEHLCPLFLAVLRKDAGSAFQNVAQKDVRHDQAARHMDRPFERAAFARRLGGLSVPAQITVPFAADVVRKTGFAVPVSYTHLDVYKRQRFSLFPVDSQQKQCKILKNPLL